MGCGARCCSGDEDALTPWKARHTIHLPNSYRKLAKLLRGMAHDLLEESRRPLDSPCLSRILILGCSGIYPLFPEGSYRSVLAA